MTACVLGVAIEEFQHVDVPAADDRIASDPNATRLPDAELGQLMDRLIRQRARARNHPDVTGLVDVAGHDSDLALDRA